MQTDQSTNTVALKPAPDRTLSKPRRTWLKPILLTCLALCALPFALFAAEPPTYYVNVANPTPVAPYTSWATAATNIQEAIDAGGEVDRLVLVTNGVYRTGWVDAGFGATRVALASWEQAPVVVQSVNGPGETIIEGSRVNPETGEGEDVRCAYVGAGAVLSGFTLRNGYAGEGGGAYCFVGDEWTPPGTPPGLLTNCVLTANSAYRGGGAYQGTLYRCVLTANSAYRGGGVFGGTLHNCTLTGNSVWGGDWFAPGGGGGACNSTLHNCILTANVAGGPLYDGGAGGGAYNSTLHNCILTANVAAGPWFGGAGGGAYGSQIHNSVLTGNSANYGGGVMGGTLSNCTLTRNSAGQFGGGVAGEYFVVPTVGWGWGAQAEVRNCIVLFNLAPVDSNWVHCLGEHTCTAPLLPGAGNIDIDPRLLSATHLATNSPCATAGSAAYATGTDIDGDPWGTPPAMGADQPLPASATGPLTVRVEATYTNVAIGSRVALVGRIEGHALSCEWDFGDGSVAQNQAWTHHAWSVPGRFTVRFTAYNGTEPLGVSASLEVQVDEVLRYYVDAANPAPAFPYMTWATAATNIQEAIDAGTLPGRAVVVTNGVYRTGSVETNGWNRVALLGAVVVRSVNGPAVTSIEGDWSETRCAYVGPESVLSGFTLTGGGYSGAALSAGVLTNCVLSRNSGDGASGGTLYDCVLIGNEGVGVSGATLYNCTLTGNSGGGAAQSTLYNCMVSGNLGSGVSSSTACNSLLVDNASCGASGSALYNCTLTGNGGGACGGTLFNCIVYFNGGGFNYSGASFEYSCTTPLPPGPGNIDADPELASATCLSPDSPCVGAGNPAYASGTDIDGEPWATPPAMGADQPVPGQVTGPLTVRIEAEFTSVSAGFTVGFVGRIAGRAMACAWDFGDGTAVTNQPWTDHAWTTAGIYTVRLTASNDSVPEGVNDTIVVRVNEGRYFVNAASPAPAFPYTTWETAATNIQDAIAAGPGGLVLVTDGVYRTGSAETDGINRVALLHEVTVRSVNGPEVTVIEGATGTRCAYLGPNTVLSGFTLTKGYGVPGGGVWCDSAGLLTNCVLAGNGIPGHGDSGGASGGTFRNCRFTANQNYGANRATLYDCVLTGNSGGGAVQSTLYRCTLVGNKGGGARSCTLYDCVLSDNSAGNGGGASSSTLYRCTLTGNSARDGGAVYGGTLYHCTLTGNTAENRGGGACGTSEAPCLLYNCTLIGNVASSGEGGGAVGATLYNCVVSGNSSAWVGGVCKSTLYNCTVTGNSAQIASTFGGAYDGRLYNCVVYHNTACGITSNYDSYGYTRFEYSCTTPLPPGPGNIDADPRLASATHLSSDSPCIGAGSAKYATGTDIDGEPWATPPCMGADQVVPGQATDLLVMRIETSHTTVAPGFAARFVGWSDGRLLASVWDFGDGTVLTNQALAQHAWALPGVYTVRLTGYNDSEPAGVTATLEMRVAEEIHYVNVANPSPAYPYTNWATAATSIQEAVNAGSSPGRTVLVTNGVYRTGTASTNGLNRVALLDPVLVRSVNGPGVTVIEGTAGAGGGGGAGAVRCAYVVSQAVLSGFTLTNGHTRSEGEGVLWEMDSGGGAWCEPLGVLSNCVVADNWAYSYGGGVHGGTLYDCVLNGNSASQSGGGVNRGTLSRCRLVGNSAGSGGGASYSTLRNCVLSGNTAGNGGGASDSTLRNCVLSGNTAQEGGGGGWNSTLNNCTVTGNSARLGGGVRGGALYNCTVTGNSASDAAGGVSVDQFYKLYNCIVYFNTVRGVADNYDFPRQTTFEYSCTWPRPDGPGNIDSDPLLASGTHLAPGSPCIGAGNPAYATGTDIDGEPWADPPCMGADQVMPGQAEGPLTAQISAALTDFGVGLPVAFTAEIEGRLLASVWDFGDGTVVTNQPYARHAWNAPGLYTVRLTAYNDTEPSGVSTTTTVQVSEVTSYVNVANPTPAFPYTSWATAATGIQQAIEASTFPGRTVLVSNGVYRTETRSTNGLNRIALLDPVFVRSVNGPTATVIEGADGVRCAYVGVDAVLDGFTLRNGRLPTDWSGDAKNCGGGAWCETSGSLTNCVLSGNAAPRGGGVWSGRLFRCVLTGNAAVSYGGGASDSTLYDCTLSGNSVSLEYDCGGGAAANSSLYRCSLTGNRSAAHGGGTYKSTLQNCVITGNTAAWKGGGAHGGTLTNCRLSGNSASEGGGAHGDSPYGCTLYNCTVTGNSGGGVTSESWATPSCTMSNCIIWANTRNGFVLNCGGATVAYSCTTPLPPGPGNLDAEPRFVNAAAGDFRLRPDSPCIDAGTNLVDLITTDIEGHPRPLDGNGDGIARFDMGAYEFDPGLGLNIFATLTPTGLRLDWPATALGFKLERTASLTNPVWQDVPGSQTATTVTVPAVNATELFRLMKP